jgi:DNA end-binding protein Ku
MAAARSVWKGFIQFSLVSVPVKAYTSTASGGGKVTLNQLHRDCHSRIQYKKCCATHGEIPSDQIVSGYEFADGKYVIVEPEELEKIRSPKEKAINIEAFVECDAIDPRYFSGRSWYLAPDGPIAQKGYALLRRAMADSGRNAFARVAVGGKQQLLLLRPLGQLIVAAMVSYEQEVKRPGDFESEVAPVEVDPKELQLARTLTDQLAVRELDMTSYRDDYADKLTQLIEAKVKGEEVVEAPAEEAPMVINLMEALQRSVEQAKHAASTGPAAGAKSSKPAKIASPGTAEKRASAAESRKRKTS